MQGGDGDDEETLVDDPEALLEMARREAKFRADLYQYDAIQIEPLREDRDPVLCTCCESNPIEYLKLRGPWAGSFFCGQCRWCEFALPCQRNKPGIRALRDSERKGEREKAKAQREARDRLHNHWPDHPL